MPDQLIQKYASCMYESSQPEFLRAGDVIKLVENDFKKIARHESLTNLFKDFENNPDYSHCLWAILNKNCDMIHDENKQRYFSSNLFLAPLQGLMSVLKKGTLGNILYPSIRVKPIEKTFLEEYQKYLKQKAKTENPKRTNEAPREYSKRIQTDVIDDAIKNIETLIDQTSFHQPSPQDLLASLKQQAPEIIRTDIKNFAESNNWKKALIKFEQQCKKGAQEKSKIILNKNAKEKLASLTLNQLDSQGIFFYEPNESISQKKHDISYLIQLEDMVTVKVKEDIQKEGRLVDLLLKNRMISLRRNFSDRLLNIMGNYFSKIGTPDVMSDKILLLYNQIYDDFILSPPK